MSGITVSFTNTASGTVLDLSGGEAANRTPIIGWHSHGGQNQQWTLVKVGDRGTWPVFKIKNVASGTYIDLYNGSSADATEINGWRGSEDNQNDHQNWQIISADPFGELVRIRNVGTGTFLGVYLGATGDGAKVYGWQGQGDFTDPAGIQTWRMKRV